MENEEMGNEEMGNEEMGNEEMGKWNGNAQEDSGVYCCAK